MRAADSGDGVALNNGIDDESNQDSKSSLEFDLILYMVVPILSLAIVVMVASLWRRWRSRSRSTN